jgi:hypothetical protein
MKERGRWSRSGCEQFVFALHQLPDFLGVSLAQDRRIAIDQERVRVRELRKRDAMTSPAD